MSLTEVLESMMRLLGHVNFHINRWGAMRYGLVLQIALLPDQDQAEARDIRGDCEIEQLLGREESIVSARLNKARYRSSIHR